VERYNCRRFDCAVKIQIVPRIVNTELGLQSINSHLKYFIFIQYIVSNKNLDLHSEKRLVHNLLALRILAVGWKKFINIVCKSDLHQRTGYSISHGKSIIHRIGIY